MPVDRCNSRCMFLQRTFCSGGCQAELAIQVEPVGEGEPPEAGSARNWLAAVRQQVWRCEARAVLMGRGHPAQPIAPLCWGSMSAAFPHPACQPTSQSVTISEAPVKWSGETMQRKGLTARLVPHTWADVKRGCWLCLGRQG